MFKKILNWFKTKRNRRIIAAGILTAGSLASLAYWKQGRGTDIPTPGFLGGPGSGAKGSGYNHRAAILGIESLAGSAADIERGQQRLRDHSDRIDAGLGEVEEQLSGLSEIHRQSENGLAAARDRVGILGDKIDRFQRRGCGTKGEDSTT